MNNKRSVYLLLPLVALVWGLIGWRIWAAASGPEEATPTFHTSLPKAAPASARLPRLLLGYGDPFRPVAGGERPASPLPVAAALPAAVATVAAAPPPARLAFPVRPAEPARTPAATIDWPPIRYLGIITHANGQAQVALLDIDNEELVVKVGHSAHDIRVVQLFRDSVQVSYKNQKRSFYRGAAN
jgi:hypothetical protein